MHRPAKEPSTAAAATLPAPGAAPVLLAQGLPIAWETNDIVIHRIFAAGLDLQAALGLISDQRGTSKICHAIDELDQAIRAIRETSWRGRPG